MNRQNHYFFAVELPRETKESLGHWAMELERKYPFKSWVHESDYHITLAFLGHASQNMLDDAVDLLQAGKGQVNPFPLTIKGLGTFGAESRPRILWADVRKQAILYDLQKQVWNACTNVGFQLDTKPFTPHITIARRCMETINRDNLVQIEKSLPSIMEFTVGNFVLYRTNSQSIPKYEPIIRFPLA
jgi:2'-5' RNA ligase